MPDVPEKRPTLLLVDDVPSNIELLGNVLDDRYELICATSGTEALGLTAAGLRPDLVLLDAAMPGIDGFDVCSSLKGDPLTTDIPVIFITAYQAAGTEARALAAGAVDFITKPISPAVVRARVALHLSLVRQRAALEESNRRLAESLDELKAANRRLLDLAHHDPLTGLPNRRLFFDRVAQSMSLARRDGTKLALMYIDLDRFKPINDNFGHAAGDAVLQELSRRMTSCIRASDTVGRIGGDEFIVLLPKVCDAQVAAGIGEKIRQALEAPVIVDGVDHRPSCSIGVAIAPDHGFEIIALARHADIALYEAKVAGRNQVRIYEGEGRGRPETWTSTPRLDGASLAALSQERFNAASNDCIARSP